MTKSLTTLIQISQQEIDALRNDLNVYLDKRSEIEAKNLSLDESLIRERALAENDATATPYYAKYALNVQVKKENNNRIISTLQNNIDALSDKISEAYAVLKTYEILLEKKELERLAEENRLEQKDNDELTLQRFQLDQKTSQG